MGSVEFKFEIGDNITTNNRDITIIDRECRQKIAHKGDSSYITNKKYYKFRCNKCGSEYWRDEYTIGKLEHGCIKCRPSKAKYKYEIGDTITSYDRNITIIDREIRDKPNGDKPPKHYKYYKYHCNVCGNEDWIVERILGDKEHVGCNACCKYNKKIVKGINDVCTTDPWIFDILKNKEDGYTRSRTSNDKVEVICPDCGETLKRTIIGLVNAGRVTCDCGKEKRIMELPYKYDIGYNVTSNGRDLTIIDRKRTIDKVISKSTGKERKVVKILYKYHCNVCGNEDWKIQYYVGDHKDSTGCNVCHTGSGKVLKGVNDIATNAPWMVKYIKNIEDAYTNSPASKNVIEFVCPDCGRVQEKVINVVNANQTIACPCSDGRSYPNKFMYSVLEQCGVNFQSEKRFDWSDGRFYDEYIEFGDVKIITEQHGLQHYEELPNYGKQSLEEIQVNDSYKQFLAMKNGIDYYYQIDCRVSEKDFIKKSICECGLFKILGVSPDSIDWDECDKFATSNFHKRICDYVKAHPDMRYKDFAKIFKTSEKNIGRIVRAGKKFGWIDDVRRSTTLVQNDALPKTIKPIHCITNDIYYRDAFHVCNELFPTTNEARAKRIRKSAHGGYEYGGYLFEYITQEQFNKIKETNPEKVIGDYFKWIQAS